MEDGFSCSLARLKQEPIEKGFNSRIQGMVAVRLIIEANNLHKVIAGVRRKNQISLLLRGLHLRPVVLCFLVLQEGS